MMGGGRWVEDESTEFTGERNILRRMELNRRLLGENSHACPSLPFGFPSSFCDKSRMLASSGES